MKFYMVTIRNGLRVRLRVQGVNNYRKSIDVLGTLKNEHIFMFVLKLVLGNPIVQKMDLKTVLTILRDTTVSNGPQTCSDPSFYQYLGSNNNNNNTNFYIAHLLNMCAHMSLDSCARALTVNYIWRLSS